MRLDVVAGGVDRLPDAVQIRLAVWCAWCTIPRRLRGDEGNSRGEARRNGGDSDTSEERVPHLLRVPFRRTTGGLLLLEPGADERVVETVVPFVARVLEQRTVGLSHHGFSGPRPLPHALVFDGEVVLDHVLGHTPQTLDHLHVLRRASERILPVEVR